jgi:hypothetical protein
VIKYFRIKEESEILIIDEARHWYAIMCHVWDTLNDNIIVLTEIC